MAKTIQNAFELVDTFGVPLVDLIDRAASRGIRISWVCFMSDAAQAGWSWETVAARLGEAAIDCADGATRMKLERLLAASTGDTPKKYALGS